MRILSHIKTRKNPIIAILGVIVVGGVVWCGVVYQETKWLQKELSTFISPPVTVSGVPYAIRNGHVFHDNRELPFYQQRKILAIAHFSIYNRLNPLLAFEGVSTEQLALSISSLQESRKELVDLYGDEEYQILFEDFYPSFLSLLPKLEEKRQELLQRPTEQTPGEYIELLSNTVTAYNKDIKRLMQTHKLFVANEKNPPVAYVFIGGYSTLDTFMGAFVRFQQVGRQLADDVSQRTKCITNPYKCHLTLETAALTIKNNDFLKQPLSQDMRVIKDIFTTYHHIINPDLNPKTSNEPIIVLDSSKCSYDGSAVYGIFWRAEDGARAIQLEALNDIYFFDTRKVNRVYGPYLQGLKEGGIDLLFQTQMNEYMCPDAGRDIAKVSTIYTIYEEVERLKKIVGGSESAESFSGLDNNTDIIYESDIAEDLSRLSLALHTRNEQVLAESIGHENVLEVERLLSLYYQNSSMLPQILMHVVWTDRNAANRIRRLGGLTPVTEMYISRGYPYLLLLAFNKSIVRDTDISFIVHNPYDKAALDGLRFTTYLSDLSSFKSPGDIINLMVENYSFKRERALPRVI